MKDQPIHPPSTWRAYLTILGPGILKFILNEGLARWQPATGTTLLEGWVQRLGKWVQYYFLIYLVLWSFVVGGALISACGLAAHEIAPGLSVKTWGIIHSLGAMGIVLVARKEAAGRRAVHAISGGDTSST